MPGTETDEFADRIEQLERTVDELANLIGPGASAAAIARAPHVRNAINRHRERVRAEEQAQIDAQRAARTAHQQAARAAA